MVCLQPIGKAKDIYHTKHIKVENVHWKKLRSLLNVLSFMESQIVLSFCSLLKNRLEFSFGNLNFDRFSLKKTKYKIKIN